MSNENTHKLSANGWYYSNYRGASLIVLSAALVIFYAGSSTISKIYHPAEPEANRSLAALKVKLIRTETECGKSGGNREKNAAFILPQLYNARRSPFANAARLWEAYEWFLKNKDKGAKDFEKEFKKEFLDLFTPNPPITSRAR